MKSEMKKILSIIAIVIIGSAFVLTDIRAANLTQAASILPVNEEWALMAYSAVNQNVGQNYLRQKISGGSATDYEKRILAITAQGNDPRTWGNENFVDLLLQNFDGTQIGDAGLLNDDIFGLLALRSINDSGNEVNKIRDYILAHQNSDGGWGFAIGTSSDSNTTAMAVAALRTIGSAPGSAINYLNSTRNDDGGYGFTPGQASDGASTAWVIMGLRANGNSIPESAISYLESLQLPTGAFKWKTTDQAGSQLVISYAVIALASKTLPLRTVAANPAPAPIPTPTNTPAPTLIPTPFPTFNNPTPTPVTVPIYRPTGTVQVPVNTNTGIQFNIPKSGGIQFPIPNTSPYKYNAYTGKTFTYAVGTSTRIYTAPPVVVPNPPTPIPTVIAPPQQTINLSIRTPDKTIFSGNVSVNTNISALNALIHITQISGIPLQTKSTSLGQFVNMIDNVAASGNSGWLYAVNGQLPNIGTSQYILKPGDQIQWFYGPPNTQPY